MRLKEGQTFISIPLGLQFTIKITLVNYNDNVLGVEYYSRSNQKVEGFWNLKHCIWAFEKGEYKLKSNADENISIENFRFKNDQLEDDGAYAD